MTTMPEPTAETTTRKGDWLQTFTGVQFWPCDPLPGEIFIEDIAHSLARQCRFGGHCNPFYSVAEHSVRASYLVDKDYALWALLHDASEAYLIDIPRPVKSHLHGYRAIEDGLMAAVCERFGLPREMPFPVKRADETMLVTEQRDLMAPQPAPWTFAQGIVVEPLIDRIVPWSALEAEFRFLARFNEITRGEPQADFPRPFEIGREQTVVIYELAKHKLKEMQSMTPHDATWREYRDHQVRVLGALVEKLESAR